MFHGPDWNRTRAIVTGYLEPDEHLVTLFTALIPPPESGGVVMAGALVPLVWAARHASWRHAARAAGRAAGIPVAPRMIVAMSARRIVIWRATRGWRLRDIRGELPRERVLGVTASGGGARSRRLALHLSTGSSITLLVVPAVADQLTTLLPVEVPLTTLSERDAGFSRRDTLPPALLPA